MMPICCVQLSLLYDSMHMMALPSDSHSKNPYRQATMPLTQNIDK